MYLIKEQLGKISHFLIIMIPLFAVNAVFNINYNWGGVSTIARVYIMVLSFYLTFIFSQINVEDYKEDFKKRYGWRAAFRLFFATRLFPFLFIYLLTITFTIINYLKAPNWPIDPLYKSLDGRYSNTVFYSLILFLVLKQKMRPGISIPLFIIYSIVYYVADHELYALLEPGPGVNYIKLFKYFIFMFVLFYDIMPGRFRAAKTAVLSFLTGSALFGFVLTILIFSFQISKPESYTLSITGRILIKSGFTFPVKKLKEGLMHTGNSKDIRDFFEFLDKFRIDAGYTPDELGEIIFKNNIREMSVVFSYLNRNRIILDFDKIKNHMLNMSVIKTSDLKYTGHFTQYLGLYYTEHENEFYTLYKSGNEYIKLIILRSLAFTKDKSAVIFLINALTSVEKIISETAYESLVAITGDDPAQRMNISRHNYEVIMYFRKYASKLH